MGPAELEVVILRGPDILARDFEAAFPNSRKIYEQARGVFPNGVTHDLRFLQPFPVYIDRARGSRKWDVDGHELIDYWSGHGSLLLGHCPPEVVQAVQEQAGRATHPGACHALELNPRAWWYVGFAVDCGADVCRLAYEDALGEPVATIATYLVGRRCAYPSYDWNAFRQQQGAMSLLAWAVDMARADQPVWAWSDPGPALGEAWRTLKARLGRMVG